MNQGLDTVLFTTRIADCREDESAILPEHRGVFEVVISRSGYGGLWLDFQNPQGHKSSVLIEGLAGGVTINTYPPVEDDPQSVSEEPQVRLHMDEKGVNVVN